MVNAERLRLDEADTGGVPWRRWGPYLSERQWGTVREDYGSGDNTWLFGLTNAEGNHGEDVKECYFYLDATPTSPYLKMLYKYPQAAFPYADLTFLKDANGRRPVHGGQPILQSDPHWRDLLFYEYFHGDNGAGIGASHQTGWTGTAGLLPLLFRGVSGEGLRTRGRGAIKSAAASQQRGAAR